MAEKKVGINPAAVGVAGAVVGAAVGAVAVALADKNTRGKVMKQLDHLKGMAQDQIKDIKTGINEMRNDASDTLSSGADNVKKIAKNNKK